MNLRGTVVDPGERRTVTTRHGERELAEPVVRVDSEEVGVTLWGEWAETVDHLAAGMELVVTAAKETEYRDEHGYATTGDSYVVVEPSFLVNVTDVRSWVQCPRMYYLNKLSGVPLNYPVVKGTIVHEVFGDLLRGREFDAAIEDRVADAGLDLGLLDRSAAEVKADVRANAKAIEGWLQQGTLGDGAATAASPERASGHADGTVTAASSERTSGQANEDTWRSEYTLISERFGIKGRADALRRGMPVELKTGKNTAREPRFQDKVQAACYALVLGERGGVDGSTGTPDTGTLLYTKNTALDRNEETGDLSPAKEFSIGRGLLEFVVRARNELAAMEFEMDVPTGHEADAVCEYCFEQDACMVVSGRLDQESKAGAVGTPIPEHEREYFERMYRLVEAERRETHREYAKLREQSAEERAADDRALIDLDPTGRSPLDDGRWELRTRNTGRAVSKIREGDVVLASDGDPVGGHAELARVERLNDEVILTADEPVDVRRLDVYPSDRRADTMLTALHDALLKGDPRRKAVLFGDDEPRFDDETGTYIETNAAQNEAVSRAAAAEDFALIHGPPGTGKTYTIARTIRALVDRGDRVLLSAFTNRAVDTALAALRDQGFDEFARIGTEHGIRADIQEYRLETRGEPSERATALCEAPVVAATTTSCGSRVMREQSFDVALVDEASQLTEPATLAAIERADRFVLVGDHHQLPPVVRAETDLSTSLFERLVETHPDASVMLDRQYRMAQRIQAFASREWYDGRLRPASGDVASQRVDDLAGVDPASLPDDLRDPVTFVDCAGDDGDHTDRVEAARVAGIVDGFAAAGVAHGDIGVIAPFRAQVTTISRRVPDDVAVDTVDRFQGSSKEVIVVSFVASGDLDSPIFEDYRRLNVALTRAKKSLVLVGTETALRTDDLYDRVVDWADRRHR